jgi:hypothetical protein
VALLPLPDAIKGALRLAPAGVAGLAWSRRVLCTPNFLHAVRLRPGAAANDYLRQPEAMLVLPPTSTQQKCAGSAAGETAFGWECLAGLASEATSCSVVSPHRGCKRQALRPQRGPCRPLAAGRLAKLTRWRPTRPARAAQPRRPDVVLLSEREADGVKAAMNAAASGRRAVRSSLVSLPFVQLAHERREPTPLLTCGAAAAGATGAVAAGVGAAEVASARLFAGATAYGMGVEGCDVFDALVHIARGGRTAEVEALIAARAKSERFARSHAQAACDAGLPEI